MNSVLSTVVPRGAALAAWTAYSAISVTGIVAGARHGGPHWFQIDWRVYVAGARDLLDRTLYRESLYVDGLPLPVTEFNLPPLSALWAVPLAGFQLESGGVVWQLAMAAALGVSAYLIAKTLRVARPALLAGVALLPLAVHVSYLEGLIGGTNQNLVLAFVSLFAWAHLHGRQRTAGIALALAIGTKLWPVALLPLLLRERRWASLRWTAGLLVLQVCATAVWLGPDVGAHMLEAIRIDIPIESAVIGFTALRLMHEWWPAWVAPVVALVFVALPVRGRAAVGLGILAGLAVIPRLWLPYLPTVLAAVALIAADVWVTAAPLRNRLRERHEAWRRTRRSESALRRDREPTVV